MKVFDRLVLKVFLYGLPVVIAMAIGCSFYDVRTITGEPRIAQIFYNSFGLVLGCWMIFSLYLSTRLVLSAAFREATLSKLAFMRERDEREVLMSGAATKTAFLTTLALLICLLCLSALSIAIYRVTPDQAVGGKTGMLSLNLRMNLTDEGTNASLTLPTDQSKISKIYFSFDGIPLSKEAVILILILWMLLSYNLAMRRQGT